MTFQSVLYLIFLPVVWLVSAVCRRPNTKQWALLTASYVFYASWVPAMLVVLIASSVFNYAWGTRLRRDSRPAVLWIGLGVNIVLLALFKYVAWLLALVGIQLSTFQAIIAPIGLSFYTFQAMSYLLDTYRAKDDVTPSFREFALYMAFWPTVLAGPVCRTGEMVSQFRRLGNSTYDDIAEGSRRVLIGLFMKVVVADTLAFGLSASEGVNSGFDSLSEGWGGLDVWFLAVGYGFQLFFDFAGYSHVVIGSARCFGIRLRENFDQPYLSRTPAEFWTRWHKSLSSWIRDYVFFPLAAARQDRWWRYVALVISMTIFGLWHGSAGTFVLWGFYHGCVLAGHRLVQEWRRSRDEAPRSTTVGALGLAGSWVATFALISLGWVLFRANSLEQAAAMLAAVANPATYVRLSLRVNFYILVSIVTAGYFGFAGVRTLMARAPLQPVPQLRWIAAPAFYAAVIVAVIVWSQQSATFVYTQF